MYTEQVRLEFFENGYGISVITGGYGDKERPFEVAVLKGTEGKAEPCYDTPITNDVIGFLSSYEVDALATEIEALPCKDAPQTCPTCDGCGNDGCGNDTVQECCETCGGGGKLLHHPDATTFEEYIGKATSCVELVHLAFEWKTLPDHLRIEGD